MSNIVPKQWPLGKNETLNSFECWKNNITYILALNKEFEPFLKAKWSKNGKGVENRGFTTTPGEGGESATRKNMLVELMLGQIANYAPVVSRKSIVHGCQSLDCVWQLLRLHYGFNTSGAQFLDYTNIRQEPDERPEDLFQRLVSFVDDALLGSQNTLQHHGAVCKDEEEVSPTLENMVVLRWLELLDPGLPRIVQQRYGTELRNHTLGSLKPEISKALPSLLDELRTVQEVRVMRTNFNDRFTLNSQPSQRHSPRTPTASGDFMLRKKKTPVCPLCQALGRPHDHFLSKCRKLSSEDRAYMKSARSRQLCVEDEDSDPESDSEPLLQGTFRQVNCQPKQPSHEHVSDEPTSLLAQALRVRITRSPYFDAFANELPVRVILDSGATGNVIREDVARTLGCKIRPTRQQASQADGQSALHIVGETTVGLSRGAQDFTMNALVATSCDAELLASNSFLEDFDITIRPAKSLITFADGSSCTYARTNEPTNTQATSRAITLRASTNVTVLPGEYLQLPVPVSSSELLDGLVAIQPKSCLPDGHLPWPPPEIVPVIGGVVRIVNHTHAPARIRKRDHVCEARLVSDADTHDQSPTTPLPRPAGSGSIATVRSTFTHSDKVVVDPQNALEPYAREKFRAVCRKYDEVFDPVFPGYNGNAGPFRNVVNMGSSLPPQRKGRVPQYAKDKLDKLQDKFDELEKLGVFARPEDVGVSVEYLNPSFLVAKSTPGAYRLVTAFGEVGRYAKPQPALMSDLEATLRQIGRWKYIVKADLIDAFYQIPLDRGSMKYCGVVTPFKGVRVYQRSAMGMPGSETALEELMTRILGDVIQDGSTAKIADDIFCGADSIDELLVVWERVLHLLAQNSIRLSASKTIICPRTVQILGWIWSEGTLSASPHRVAALASASPPDSTKGLRSWVGAYKVVSRTVPECATLLAPFEALTAGKQSADKVMWTDDDLLKFSEAQKALRGSKSIVLPRPEDQLWIVTDGSTKHPGLGATLYVTRDGSLHLAGFFSAKLRDRQHTWLPCEIEALAIHCSVNHWAPYIIQSSLKPIVLTDSKPCVQAHEKLCRGQFSTSPRVSTFLSSCCRYQVTVRHLAGTANVSSDFASRNAPECLVENCQVCSFVHRSEDATVLRTSTLEDILNGATPPFTSRHAWRDIQSECPDLRRTHGFLSRGSRPTKRQNRMKDVKRYLQHARIASDGLLVVNTTEPLGPVRERIVIPRRVLDGVVQAWHLQLAHPSAYQLHQVFTRYFYALNLDQAIKAITDSCAQCNALLLKPKLRAPQSTGPPPSVVGESFAADVIRAQRQYIFVVRETVSSYTKAVLISDERHETLRSAILQTVLPLVPGEIESASIRTDPAPGFQKLVGDEGLARQRITVVLGEAKNVNKNPVAERAVQELETEVSRLFPTHGLLSNADLAIATNSLNARIRGRGLSAREIIYQRDQYTGEQLPVNDRKLIEKQHSSRLQNHLYSERSKTPKPTKITPITLQTGDLVYLYSDRNKFAARPRYIITSTSRDHYHVRKFTGNQLRAKQYAVPKHDCYPVTTTVHEAIPSLSDDDELEHHPSTIPRPRENARILTDPANNDLRPVDGEVHTVPRELVQYPELYEPPFETGPLQDPTQNLDGDATVGPPLLGRPNRTGPLQDPTQNSDSDDTMGPPLLGKPNRNRSAPIRWGIDESY